MGKSASGIFVQKYYAKVVQFSVPKKNVEYFSVEIFSSQLLFK